MSTRQAHCSSDNETNASLFDVRQFIDDVVVEKAEDDLDEELDDMTKTGENLKGLSLRKSVLILITFGSFWWFWNHTVTSMFHGWVLSWWCYIQVSTSTQGLESRTQNHLKWVIMIATLPKLTMSKNNISQFTIPATWASVLMLRVTPWQSIM